LTRIKIKKATEVAFKYSISSTTYFYTYALNNDVSSDDCTQPMTIGEYIQR